MSSVPSPGTCPRLPCDMPRAPPGPPRKAQMRGILLSPGSQVPEIDSEVDLGASFACCVSPSPVAFGGPAAPLAASRSPAGPDCPTPLVTRAASAPLCPHSSVLCRAQCQVGTDVQTEGGLLTSLTLPLPAPSSELIAGQVTVPDELPGRNSSPSEPV